MIYPATIVEVETLASQIYVLVQIAIVIHMVENLQVKVFVDIEPCQNRTWVKHAMRIEGHPVFRTYWEAQIKVSTLRNHSDHLPHTNNVA